MLSRKQIRNIVPNIVPSDFLFDQVKRLKTYLEDPLEGSQQKERGNKRKRRQQEAIEEEKKTETKENSPRKFRIGGRKKNVCPEQGWFATKPNEMHLVWFSSEWLNFHLVSFSLVLRIKN